MFIMNYFSAAIYFILMISLLAGCKKDAHKSVEGFDYEHAAGLWVPYEVTDELGTVHPGPFTANTLFGIYAESVHLKIDKTFIPASWIDKDHVTFKTEEAGTFQSLPGKKLRFQGIIEFECEVIKFEGDDLWLKMSSTSGELYKFKRQP